MEMKYKTFLVVKLTLLSFVLVGFLSPKSIATERESSDPNQNSRYLNAVREFANNVLKYGRDTYGPKHTPLFVDGLNVNTHEPVKWISPEGERWVLSNPSSQQNLFRTLDGLTTITGDIEREIFGSGFQFEGQYRGIISHDDELNKGCVLNFRKIAGTP